MAKNEAVVETHARSITSAILYINADASWSVGPDAQHLVKVQFGEYTSISDETFGFSALDAEKTNDGYRLFVQSDEDDNTIVDVALDAGGKVTKASALTLEQLFEAETEFGVDLNESGGFGAAPAALQGGSVNLYISGTGVYQLGTAPSNAQNITLSGAALTNKLLPPGWEIAEAEPSGSGYNVYVRDDKGAIFQANLDSKAAVVGGSYLTPEQLATKETTTGTDINGDLNVPAAPGWTGVLKDTLIKTTVETAIATNGKMNYSQAVFLVNSIIQTHKSTGNAPISAIEVADLQALSSRGNNLFTSTSVDNGSSDYLANVFSKMVDGSVANEFYSGGQTKRVMLGNLVPNSPLSTFEKLADKWLLGGDNPAPAAGGDTATGKAASTVGTYAQSQGTLFVDGTKPADIKQGQVGDCFLAAALLSIAQSQPDAFKSVFVDNGVLNGTHTWGVRFLDSNGKANWVTVNDLLPVTGAGSTTLIYGGNPGGDLNGEIWFPLFEKAYAEANALKILPRAEQTGQNAYWGIEGGFADPIANITGKKVVAYSLNQTGFGDNPYIDVKLIDKTDAAQYAAFQSAVVGALSSNKPVWIGSFVTTKDAYDNTLLTSGHAFSVLPSSTAPTSSAVDIYNPWGINLLPTPPANVSYLSPFPTAGDELIKLIGNPDIVFMIG